MACKRSPVQSRLPPPKELSYLKNMGSNKKVDLLMQEGGSPRNNEDESAAGARCERPGRRFNPDYLHKRILLQFK